MKRIVRLRELGVGEFAEDKALAREICQEEILPKLQAGKRVTVDFRGIEAMGQGFFYQLVALAAEQYGEVAYREIVFRNVKREIGETMVGVYKGLQITLA